MAAYGESGSSMTNVAESPVDQPGRHPSHSESATSPLAPTSAAVHASASISEPTPCEHPTAVPYAAAIASPPADFDVTHGDGLSLRTHLTRVLFGREMIVTVTSGFIHFILILILAMLTIQVTVPRLSGVLEASVEPISRPKLEDFKVIPELEKPQFDKMRGQGAPVHSSVAVTAPRITTFSNYGVQANGIALPGLNNLILGASTKEVGGGGGQPNLETVGFFGSTVVAQRVVFVVDNSLSMRGQKMLSCKLELLAAVSRLSAKQKFYVFLFSDTDHPLFEPNSPDELMNMTTKLWPKFEQWVTGAGLYLGTRARSSLEKAFQMEPDVIFLLTDGAFTDDTFNFLMTLPETSVRINTIGFQATNEGAAGLMQISAKFNGEYTYVK